MADTAPEPLVLALDAGTTGLRTIAFDRSGRPVIQAYRELTQHFPRPGWVEHDPEEIWAGVAETLAEVLAAIAPARPVAIGITNQRETAVAWDRATGRPRHRAIVWQDRRTAPRCRELEQAGHLPLVRERTGLVLDSYFSATKWEWMLGPGGVEADDSLALGTVDSWVMWRLTGGRDGGVFATDPSNASRTLIFDIASGRWDPDLADLFGIPVGALAEVRGSSGRFAETAAVADGIPAGIPVSGVAGDQQAALFGQACFQPGMTKNTYGTGSFVLMNVGDRCPPPTDGLLTTVAWDLGAGAVTYALEGSIFVTGAAVQWLRDGLAVISEAAETEALATSIASSEGVYFVPALTGLGSPWWDPDARGLVTGLSRGSGRAHLARAAVEAMALQTRDVIESMSTAGGHPPAEMRVDGGAAVMDFLLRIQAQQVRVPVARSAVIDTTARGAAWLAGMAEGVWTMDELAATWSDGGRFEPAPPFDDADALYAGWHRAVERSRRWAAAPG